MKKIVISFVFIFACSQLGLSQKPQLSIKYFTKEEGLLTQNIKSVTQDSIGFVWIATNNGLYRFDGYDFKAYYSSEHDSGSLLNNEIFCLYVDSKANLWVGTKSGLNKYNHELDNFERCNDLDRFSDIIDKYILQISEDKNGNLLVSCENYLFKYNDTNKEFTPLLSIEEGKIKHILVDKSNCVWMSCTKEKGLKKFNLGTQKWEEPLPNEKDRDNLFKSYVSHFSLSNDTLWIATKGDGVKMLNIRSGQYVSCTGSEGDEAMAIFTFVDNSNNIWTIDYTGLNYVDKQALQIIEKHPKTIRKKVKGIFQDMQGNYWFFHGPGGLGVSMALKGFENFSSDTRDFWHTSSKNITALSNDAYGNLWSGNSEGGVSVFKYKQRKNIVYRHNPKDKFSIGKGEVVCIFCDSKGIMWLSSYSGGLQYFDEKNNMFIEYKHDPKDNNSIAGNDIRSIAEDSDGNLWLAVHGKGVDKFNRKEQKFTHFNSRTNKLPKDWTYDVLIDHKGDLWVATSWGLGHLAKDSSIFTSYYSEKNDSTSLPNSFINTIHEDANQVLWVGTSKGLSRYNREKDNFTQFDIFFNSKNISAIVCDRDNNLWVGTLEGLVMIDYKRTGGNSFGLVDGLIGDEFNPRSCYKSSNGELYFGTTNGIIRFKPHKLNYNTNPPFVFVDKIKVLDNEIIIGANKHQLKKIINHTKKIVLNHSDNVISISYKALNLINPQLNQYKYKLEGFDKEWHFAGTARNATYTNLDPGTYTFRIKASNNDGFWNNEGASIKITVLPPWWATWWFRGIVIFMVLGLLYWVYRARISFYKKQQKKLNDLVKERTKELEGSTTLLEERQEEINQQNEELKSQHDALKNANDKLQEKQLKIEEQNKELDKHRNHLELIVNERTKQLIEAKEKAEESDRLKTSFLENFSHEIRTPLNAIIGFSSIIARKKLSKKDKKVYSQYIRNNGDSLLNLINDIIDLSKIESGHVDINLKEVNLVETLNELTEVFKVQLSKLPPEVVKNLELKINIAPDLQKQIIKTDPLRIKQIFINLISNAIKFTDNGTIEIGCSLRENKANIGKNANLPLSTQELLFFVKDKGVGISKENLKVIFERFRKVEEDKDNLYRGTGLGLTISEQLVKLFGGQIWAESEHGQGTTFYFTLPFMKAGFEKEPIIKQNSVISKLPSFEGVTILVAEDDLANFAYIEDLLNETQATVLHAADGKQAVWKMETNPEIQLVLMDIKMPVMDGIEAFHAIRSKGNYTPIIAQTAYAFSDEVEKLMQNGFDGYISKPLHEETLYASIFKVLNKK